MSALTPRQMFLLDEACKPIAAAFGGYPYLVGTAGALKRQAYRDVDVRLILSDERYDALLAATSPECIAFLGISIGECLETRTGLPIDFQVQRQSNANHHHAGERNPLGVRDLGSYVGDGRKPVPTAAAIEPFHASFNG